MKLKTKLILIIILLTAAAVIIINIFTGGFFLYTDFDQKYGTHLSEFYDVKGGKRELTQYGIRYEYQIVTEEMNSAFLYFTEGDHIQDPGKLRQAYKQQNSLKQKCGKYDTEITLYEFTDIPVDKDNFSAVLYVRYSNDKGTFLLIYYPERVWTGKPSEDTYRYDQTDTIHEKDDIALEEIIDKLN